MGQAGEYQGALVWDCGDGGLFAIWTCHFCVKKTISVSACYSLINCTKKIIKNPPKNMKIWKN